MLLSCTQTNFIVYTTVTSLRWRLYTRQHVWHNPICRADGEDGVSEFILSGLEADEISKSCVSFPGALWKEPFQVGRTMTRLPWHLC